MKTPSLLSIASFGLLLGVNAATSALEPATCTDAVIETPLADTFGSVSLMANLRGSSGSIRAVAADLLGAAVNAPAPPADGCPAGCAGNGRTIVYKVLPTAYLNQDRQRPECLQFERETTAKPLRFDDREFASLEAMNKWITDFSRGKGADGKALYAACSSNCSPRYTFLIDADRDDGTLVLDAKVVCGLARDKKVKQYSLSTAVRAQCATAISATVESAGGHGE